MNTAALLDQSHMLVLQTVEDFPEDQWDTPGACGDWSVKDTIAHLTSYEHLLVDILDALVNDAPTPYLDKFVNGQPEFNTSEVAARQYHTAQQIIDEYNETQLQSSDLLVKIPAEKMTQAGVIPWSKDRTLVEMINILYRHTNDHCTQIKAFREKEHA
ncbi:MAG TPA: DinB family protein [Ktedonobacteraceae bacterium]|jgi:hypothetical protein